jgi:aryl-alcohol dehydrogenase-like predicted oxidoreductase
MAMSGTYGPVDDRESTATIHEAIERGITLLDTGDFYGRGHTELLLREALKGGKRDRVFLQVKFGAQLEPSGRFIGFDGRPASVKTFLTYSLTRLGTDHVDLYQPSRLDPRVPIEDTVGAVADMVKAGTYDGAIGLCMGAVTGRRHRSSSGREKQAAASRFTRCAGAIALASRPGGDRKGGSRFWGCRETRRRSSDVCVGQRAVESALKGCSRSDGTW